MDENRLRIVWMQSVLRLHCHSNPSGFTDEEVVSCFAALPQSIQYAGYETWLASMGIKEVIQQERDAANNQSAINIIKSTMPDAKIEEQKS